MTKEWHNDKSRIQSASMTRICQAARKSPAIERSCSGLVIASSFGSCRLLNNYRDRAKILLAMSSDPAKSGGHEVCSSVHTRPHWVCIANLRGFATALSGETGATI
jgi:hypothetical protein